MRGINNINNIRKSMMAIHTELDEMERKEADRTGDYQYSVTLTKLQRIALIKTRKHKLPVPRLQLTWMKTDEHLQPRYMAQCFYTIVLPDDSRGERHGILGHCYNNLERTRIDGKDSPPVAEGRMALKDADELQMPLYEILGDCCIKVV
jgi:hypothetical protein